jgi:ATP-dependent RNA helicase DeaD
MTQAERDRVMNRLRAGTADLLVATDVAARGLDVDHLTHVVNYNVPSAPETYVHRIGRVGRAGREGVAITLVEPRERRMVEAIEHLTKTKLHVTPVPSVADLRASRLAATRETLLAALTTDLTDARKVVAQLAEEHDPLDIAAAALSLVHGTTDEEEIPAVPPRQPRPERDDRPSGRPFESKGPKQHKAPATGMAKVYIGAGRDAKVAPKDLVGAIAGETHLSGKQIGAIEITPKFSLVEVPARDLDTVVKALRASVIKGRKVSVRPDRNG